MIHPKYLLPHSVNKCYVLAYSVDLDLAELNKLITDKPKFETLIESNESTDKLFREELFKSCNNNEFSHD